MPIGDDILALDFNAIRSKVIEIIGPGTGQKGYGQSIASSAVFAGNNITAEQWDLLKLDLINIKLHQDGISPTIADIASGDVIRYRASQPNFNYNSIIDQATLSKFSLGTGQSIVSAAATQSRTGSWSTQSQCTFSATFATIDEARYFFNSGGRLRFTSSRTGGTVTSQNNAWTNLLNTTVGVVQFGAQDPETINFYNLTTSYQQIYQVSSSTPYSNNYFRIEALCNCTDATNVNGTASAVTFRITWRDDYVDPGPGGPGDTADGTLTVTVDELKASGPLLPSGSFTIASPAYSISAISAS
jgi:hypothetical protein